MNKYGREMVVKSEQINEGVKKVKYNRNKPQVSMSKELVQFLPIEQIFFTLIIFFLNTFYKNKGIKCSPTALKLFRYSAWKKSLKF